MSALLRFWAEVGVVLCGALVWSLRCMDVSSSAFRGWSSSVEVCPCGEGIHGVWVWGHVFDICVLVGGGPVGRFMLGFMGLRSEFIGGLGLFHPGMAMVGSGRSPFGTWPPLRMGTGVVEGWGWTGWGGVWAAWVWAVLALVSVSPPFPPPRKEGDHVLGPRAGCPSGVLVPEPGTIEYVREVCVSVRHPMMCAFTLGV
ncbi:hypothetical protein ILYODFUR_029167 [Ilyodon furcidens]|uniref:Secreted protein n=1 Tax=Ilyodon furcidens TaxID=33524 RepID=A0ABV0UXF6_9TELE